MSALGSIANGVGSFLKGMAAKKAGKQQERALNMAADQVAYEAGISTALTLEQGQRATGDLIVNAAASGGGTSGSALNVLADLERQISFQSRNIVIEGQNKRQRLQYEGRVAKQQGQVAFGLGIIEAGASFLDAGGQMMSAGQGGAPK